MSGGLQVKSNVKTQKSKVGHKEQMKKSGASILKYEIITILVLLFFYSSVFAEDTIWNRVFFDDFKAIGGAVIEDPLKTGLITAGFGAATYLLIKNDLWISKTVRSGPNKFKDTFFDIFNRGGDGLTVLAGDALLFSLGGEKEKKTAVSVVEGLAVAGAITNVIKIICGRERPSQTDDSLAFTWFTFDDAAYPSGHTTTAFVAATIIGDRYDIGWITYPAAALTGIARIYRGAHWPSDVLLGAVIGIVTGKVINNLDMPKNVSFTPAMNGVSLSYNF